jgi:hypothetical protein
MIAYKTQTRGLFTPVSSDASSDFDAISLNMWGFRTKTPHAASRAPKKRRK